MSGGLFDPLFVMSPAMVAALGHPSFTPATTSSTRPAGEFDGHDAEFSVGSVFGTRSFDVDGLGRLRGVAYRTVWTPGENRAQCLARGGLAAYMFGGGTPQPAEIGEHSMTVCGHGFYGYFEGSNDYYEVGRVMGVVEAYGEAVIGSRGFRASKARIVALHIPAEVRPGARALIVRNYAGVPVFDSFEAMVGEFPPTDAGAGVSPANDPDFWTREA